MNSAIAIARARTVLEEMLPPATLASVVRVFRPRSSVSSTGIAATS